MTAVRSVLTVMVFSWAGWAASAPGVPNFQEVDKQVYRGGQPTREGFQSLSRIGVKTILDLRDGEVREEKKWVESLGMRYTHIPMRGMRAPSDKQILDSMAILQDKANGPVFVHCKRGADRTGTVIACYRMIQEHWEPPKALAEAKLYGMSPFQRAMRKFILAFHIPEGLAAGHP